MDNRRILIVDDNPDIHQDYRKVLVPQETGSDQLAELESQLFGKPENRPTAEKLDYSIDSAFQGEQALKMVEEAAKNGNPYSLILMDVRMPPGWDGIETIKRIWAVLPFTEVILCTAFSDHSSEDIINSLGVSHRLLILKKPFDSLVLKHMVLASVTKWNLEKHTRINTEQLEQTVRDRTAMLVQTSKMSALGEMAGGIAHEINTPLAALTMNTEMILETIGTPEFSIETLRSIEQTNMRTIERIAKIIKGLLTFCRQNNSDPMVNVPAMQIIQDTVALCEERLRLNGVKLELPSSLDIEVKCRPSEIEQVLLNLLHNADDAIKALPEKWIRIGCKAVNGQVQFSVCDSGPGIPPEVQAQMFQPFFTTKEIGKGTGLGLSVSHGIISGHGGALSYDKTNKNTCFLLTVPLGEASEIKAS